MIKLFNWKSLRMLKSHQLLISPNIVYATNASLLIFHIHPRNHGLWDINLNFFVASTQHMSHCNKDINTSNVL